MHLMLHLVLYRKEEKQSHNLYKENYFCIMLSNAENINNFFFLDLILEAPRTLLNQLLLWKLIALGKEMDATDSKLHFGQFLLSILLLPR